MSATDARNQVRVPWWSDEVMYWLEDQVVVVFQSSLPYSTEPSSKEGAIRSLNLANLDQFLTVRGLKLESFTSEDVSHPSQDEAFNAHSGDLNDSMGKYLFPLPDGEGTLVVGFFNVSSSKTFHATQDISTLRALRRGGQVPCCDEDSNTRKAVDLINGNLDRLRQQAKVPVIAAAPNWLGGANCYGHGCPVFPPLPVPQKDTCSCAEGRWPIQIPSLQSEASPLKETTGESVTVFVLDTMPDIKDNPSLIQDAAARAGASNKLLQEIAEQKDRAASPFIKFHYRDLPAQIREDAEDQIVTGRDINGNPYGFHMPDHGLFVVGIIRDLVCEADIEYIRVLNDFGICSVGSVMKALEEIQGRMAAPTPTLPAGDLYGKPVVVNLSLVVTPSDEDLLQVWYGMDPPMMNSSMNGGSLNMGPSDASQKMGLSEETKYDMSLLRAHLRMAILSLATSGAVIVASAGNDSNWPDMPGRIGPRYPAAFPEVIAVGAVDKNGQAARYSNYPQLAPHTNGIATYGGSIPTLSEIETDTGIDAMRGVYSDTYYPYPVAENPPLPDYDPHDPIGWAYWSGTSFATPIISAVAARVLQSREGVWALHERVPGVHKALTTPEGQQQYLTGTAPLPLQPDFGNGVSLLMAYQCVDEAQSEAQEEASGTVMDMAVQD